MTTRQDMTRQLVSFHLAYIYLWNGHAQYKIHYFIRSIFFCCCPEEWGQRRRRCEWKNQFQFDWSFVCFETFFFFFFQWRLIGHQVETCPQNAHLHCWLEVECFFFSFDKIQSKLQAHFRFIERSRTEGNQFLCFLMLVHPTR